VWSCTEGGNNTSTPRPKTHTQLQASPHTQRTLPCRGIEPSEHAHSTGRRLRLRVFSLDVKTPARREETDGRCKVGSTQRDAPRGRALQTVAARGRSALPPPPRAPPPPPLAPARVSLLSGVAAPRQRWCCQRRSHGCAPPPWRGAWRAAVWTSARLCHAPTGVQRSSLWSMRIPRGWERHTPRSMWGTCAWPGRWCQHWESRVALGFRLPAAFVSSWGEGPAERYHPTVPLLLCHILQPRARCPIEGDEHRWVEGQRACLSTRVSAPTHASEGQGRGAPASTERASSGDTVGCSRSARTAWRANNTWTPRIVRVIVVGASEGCRSKGQVVCVGVEFACV
jgi:hypothetical protein